MNGGLSDYQEQAFLDSILTGYVALFSDTPTDTGGTELTTVTAPGYARQAITSVRTGSQIANNATISFGPATTTDWPEVKGFKVMDALTNGNCKYHGECINTKTIVVADPSTNKLAATAHGLTNGTRVAMRNKDGALPGGVSGSTVYFVVNASTNDFEISATQGGAAVDITSTGNGTNAIFCTAFKILQVGLDTLNFQAGDITFSLD